MCVFVCVCVQKHQLHVQMMNSNVQALENVLLGARCVMEQETVHGEKMKNLDAVSS